MVEISIKSLSLETAETETEDCEAAEEAVTTDSDEYLLEPLRNKNSLQYSTSSTNSAATLTPNHEIASEENGNYYSCTNELNFNNIEIPIIGYEVMEERARFTAFKLKIINKATGSYWFVFRRYTDFVRLCNKLKPKYPQILQYLPRKRWIGNNFEPIFLEERVSCLQTLVNAIITETDLIKSPDVQDFFCLNDPPLIETNEESQAVFEVLEDTVIELRKQLEEKDKSIDKLQDTLHSKLLEIEHLKKIIRNSTLNCQKCHKEYANISKALIKSTESEKVISHSLPR